MYELVLDETQNSVASSAATVAARVGGRRLAELDAAQNAAIADSALYALGLPESVGGVGLGCAEEAVAFEQLGRTRCTPGLLAPVLAAHLLAEQSSPVDGLDISAVLTGQTPVALAEPIHADQDGAIEGGWRVVERAGARYAVGVTPVDVVLIDLGVDASGEVRGVDRDTELHIVDNATTLAYGSGALRNRALTLVSALATGMSEAVLELAVEHAKIREQFGKPIATFQAVKHMLADMAVNHDASKAVTYLAATVLDADQDAEIAAATAKSTTSRGAVDVVRSAIQVFGGMGVTDECELHLYLRRAHLLDKLFGGPEFHEERLVRLVEGAA